MSEGVIGNLHWRDCEYCGRYRPDVGSCEPLDECGIEGIIDFAGYEADYITCCYYEMPEG